jgi:hypothetical protein
MKTAILFAVSMGAALSWATASLAGITPLPVVGAPAPLLGAGLPGLAIMAVAGAGYLAIRLRRRGKD